jgi:lipoprotein NlpD
VRGFASTGNKGVDISGRLGDPVYAAAPGRVVYSGSGLRGYGKLIIVKHNNRYLSAYAHNHRLLVKEGDPVANGQRIAQMGRTDANRVKLHFEIRRNGKPVDPLSYLPKTRPPEANADA